MENQLICLPENDQELRYLLAKKGKKNLLVIGLNPSTANATQLDPTTKNIQTVAEANGYDGWLLVNLYPRRKTDPVDLELTEDSTIYWENLRMIRYLLEKDQFKIKDAWVAWGDGIDSYNHPYLKQAAAYLYRMLTALDLNYKCIGRTRKENPRHPSPQSLNCHVGPAAEIQFINFDFKQYVKDIKTLPEITLNGLKFE